MSSEAPNIRALESFAAVLSALPVVEDDERQASISLIGRLVGVRSRRSSPSSLGPRHTT